MFNFEGGCYAKVINLDKDAEPDIYNAIKRNALSENVTVDKDGKIDFADKSVTENTRVSYPIDHIEDVYKRQKLSLPGASGSVRPLFHFMKICPSSSTKSTSPSVPGRMGA